VIIGSAVFAGSPDENTVLQTAVHITINEQYFGKYVLIINIEKD
jgi:Cu+-exporting ATPase